MEILEIQEFAGVLGILSFLNHFLFVCFFIVCLIVFLFSSTGLSSPYHFLSSSPGPSSVASFWGISLPPGARDDGGADEPKWAGAAAAAQPGCHIHMYLGLLTKSEMINECLNVLPDDWGDDTRNDN